MWPQAKGKVERQERSLFALLIQNEKTGKNNAVSAGIHAVQLPLSNRQSIPTARNSVQTDVHNLVIVADEEMRDIDSQKITVT